MLIDISAVYIFDLDTHTFIAFLADFKSLNVSPRNAYANTLLTDAIVRRASVDAFHIDTSFCAFQQTFLSRTYEYAYNIHASFGAMLKATILDAFLTGKCLDQSPRPCLYSIHAHFCVNHFCTHF